MRVPEMLPVSSRLHGHASRQELPLTLRVAWLLGFSEGHGQSLAGAGGEVQMSRRAAGSAAGV